MEDIRKEFIGRELELIGGKDDVQVRKPVGGKGRKNSKSSPNAIAKFLDQYTIGGSRRTRFMKDVSKMRGRTQGRSGMALHEEKGLQRFLKQDGADQGHGWRTL